IERLLTEYDDVPTEFRLVEIDKTGNTLFKTPVFDENRKQRIVDFLCSPSEDLIIERSFLRTTTFEYDRIIHNERQKFTGTIPEKWIKSPLTLPAYKEKKKVCL